MKFSVIVPVYRTGAYLDKCIQSVLRQSCRDFELILVDDCSPDDCGRRCDEYAALDSRVRVIHKPVNEGLGFARNTGLAAARGELVLFLDSDDWIHSGLLEQCAQAQEADILVFGTTFVYEAKNRKEQRIPQAWNARTAKEIADAFAMLTRARIFQFAWNKCYRREFLQKAGVAFEQTRLIEDFLFNIALLPQAQSLVCIPQPLHFYRRPPHQTLASEYSPEFFNLCKRKFSLELEYLEAAQAREYTQLILQGFVKHLISAVVRNRCAGLAKAEQRQALTQMLNDPVTAEALTQFHPSSPVYRLLKDWLQKKRTGLLLAACRILK